MQARLQQNLVLHPQKVQIKIHRSQKKASLVLNQMIVVRAVQQNLVVARQVVVHQAKVVLRLVVQQNLAVAQVLQRNQVLQKQFRLVMNKI